MSRRLPPCLLSAALMSLAFAPAPLPRPDHGKDDLRRMQGAWVLAHSEKDGVRTPAEQEAVWLVEGDRVTTSLGGKKASVFTIALDGRRSPRAIDIKPADGKTGPAPGRYSREGDALKVCVG